METSAKPFVKWIGGKRQILDRIRAQYPTGLGESITKYAEPFVGGGAVMFDILNSFPMKEIYISDINKELINVYTTIRDDVDALIMLLAHIQEDWWKFDDAQRRYYYYKKRDQFNSLKMASGNKAELAALFIFLNRTCFNGVYKVNTKGDYNVAIGSHAKPMICDEQNLQSVSVGLKNIQIVCGDYKLSKAFVDNKTFVYFDPPYRPLPLTSKFVGYTQDGFGDDKQVDLADFINELNEDGASIMLSNSDPKNTNPNDNFFDTLYGQYTIQRIKATRCINGNASGRGAINELLITNY